MAGDHQAGDGADHDRQHDHARFAGAHDGAQAMRNFERRLRTSAWGSEMVQIGRRAANA